MKGRVLEMLNLNFNTSYLLCLFESDQDAYEILASQCFQVTTKYETFQITNKIQKHSRRINLIFVLTFSSILVISIVAILFHVKRRYELKQENPHFETDSIQYYEPVKEKIATETNHLSCEINNDKIYLEPLRQIKKRDSPSIINDGLSHSNQPEKSSSNYLTPIFLSQNNRSTLKLSKYKKECDGQIDNKQKDHNYIANENMPQETAYMVITSQNRVTSFSNCDVKQRSNCSFNSSTSSDQSSFAQPW